MANHKHKRGAHIRIRLLITAFFILLQIAFFVSTAYFFAGQMVWIYGLFQGISFVTVAIIVTKKGNPSYKLTWIIFILLFPLK